jgi:hypothetical protein
MRWIADLWARWRTRKARQRAEYEAMYQATVNALAAGMRMDAAKAKRSKLVYQHPPAEARPATVVLDFDQYYNANGWRYWRVDVTDKPKVH